MDDERLRAFREVRDAIREKLDEFFRSIANYPECNPGAGEWNSPASYTSIWRVVGEKNRSPPQGIAKLRVHPWSAILPGRRRFELRGNTDQQMFSGKRCYELHADRQTRRVPVQRQGDGRLAGDIEGRREGTERSRAAKSREGIALGRSELTEQRWWFGGRWREQQVESAFPPARQAPCLHVRDPNLANVRRDGDTAPHFRQSPR